MKFPSFFLSFFLPSFLSFFLSFLPSSYLIISLKILEAGKHYIYLYMYTGRKGREVRYMYYIHVYVFRQDCQRGWKKSKLGLSARYWIRREYRARYRYSTRTNIGQAIWYDMIKRETRRYATPPSDSRRTQSLHNTQPTASTRRHRRSHGWLSHNLLSSFKDLRLCDFKLISRYHTLHTTLST